MDSELPCALQGRTWEKIENGAVKLAQHKDKGIMLVAAHACYIGNEIYRLSIQQSEEKITIYDQETDVPDELKNYAFSVLDKQVAPADVCALIFAPNEPSKGESVNAVVVDYSSADEEKNEHFISIFAASDLAPGEEILICYGDSEWGNDDDPYTQQRKANLTGMLVSAGRRLASLHKFNPMISECKTNSGNKRCAYCVNGSDTKNQQTLQRRGVCKACMKPSSKEKHTCKVAEK